MRCWRGKEVLQWTGLSAKRNDEEGGGGGDERGGAERGNEQQSMNGVGLTDRNGLKYTHILTHKHR